MSARTTILFPLILLLLLVVALLLPTPIAATLVWIVYLALMWFILKEIWRD